MRLCSTVELNAIVYKGAQSVTMMKHLIMSSICTDGVEPVVHNAAHVLLMSS